MSSESLSLSSFVEEDEDRRLEVPLRDMIASTRVIRAANGRVTEPINCAEHLHGPASTLLQSVGAARATVVVLGL